MDHALSLKTGEFVAAEKSNYSSSRKLLLVCPECGEPVHYKLREIPHKTPFFSHPKEIDSIKLMKQCSLRTEGGEYKIASSVIRGLSHGQLVDRFQREFCKGIYESLGSHASTLSDFIKESRFLNLEPRDYHRLIKNIEELAPFNEILTSKQPAGERQIFEEGIHDICLFLSSSYGTWVGNFIYQAAYFVACITHPDIFTKQLGRIIHNTKRTNAIFIGETYRMRQWQVFASETLAARSKRNLAIPQIAATLVAYLLLSWRFRAETPKLLTIEKDALLPSAQTIAPKEKFDPSGSTPEKRTTSRDEPNLKGRSPVTGLPQEVDNSVSAYWWGNYRSNSEPPEPIAPPQLPSTSSNKKPGEESSRPSTTSSLRAITKKTTSTSEWWEDYVQAYNELGHQSIDSSSKTQDAQTDLSPNRGRITTSPSKPPTKDSQQSATKSLQNPEDGLIDSAPPEITPTDIGNIPDKSDAERADLETRLKFRIKSLHTPDSSDNAEKWVYFSDLDSIINSHSLQYVQRNCFKMSNGLFTLTTKFGSFAIPYKNVLWR